MGPAVSIQWWAMGLHAVQVQLPIWTASRWLSSGSSAVAKQHLGCLQLTSTLHTAWLAVLEKQNLPTDGAQTCSKGCLCTASLVHMDLTKRSRAANKSSNKHARLQQQQATLDLMSRGCPPSPDQAGRGRWHTAACQQSPSCHLWGPGPSADPACGHCCSGKWTATEHHVTGEVQHYVWRGQNRWLKAKTMAGYTAGAWQA